MTGSAAATVHAQIRVQGQVQGVGFRPFVHRLASEMQLCGWVRNTGDGVDIALQGQKQPVLRLIDRLQQESPALARIDNISAELSIPVNQIQGFSILESKSGRLHTGICPDMSPCPDCLHELFAPADRRYRYAFINCIHCGPRYTITANLPYDRVNTSMAAFALCPACRAEYEYPGSRRFHAQPNACPECGPQLKLRDENGQPQATSDPLAATATRILAGEIVAIKGVGGYHLVCAARNFATVERLRSGKNRDEKPFAVMVLNAASARLYADFDDHEAALLASQERPVVLLNKSPQEELPGIAPGLSRIGLMLPNNPLNYLLFHELLGRPAGYEWLDEANSLALVMTSGNLHGEPLARNETEAKTALAGIAAAYLSHDRDILHRCDDSVMKWQGVSPIFVRRARGFVPRRIVLPFSGPAVLSCGAFMKNTVCLTRENEAFVSPHIGDLDQAATRLQLDETVSHLCDLLDVAPQVVAHDLHPDFYSTQFAQNYAAHNDLPLVGVQHHHAHIAAICAEHGVSAPVLGLALDGVGLGSDRQPWGGELLRVEGVRCDRLGHLAPLIMQGGEKAAREPWKMACAALHKLGRSDEIALRFSAQPLANRMSEMLRLPGIATSSMGRLFDAAAGLLGISQVQTYEGHAAMLLESQAGRHGDVAPLVGGYILSRELDFSPLLGKMADCRNVPYGAALFHATIAAGLLEWVQLACEQHDIRTVALGGGCFLNGILSRQLRNGLQRHGLRVLTAEKLPCNDGGISLGQAWVALNKGV